ncbi:unnamed protein product [Eruca vesicaria subsp. sativa]|uniref:F-box domain-containing protein n=1 Tax=Eruca vesicaria subsp. sativa TaxID=29727 RepID=A0ABC8K3S9_ERUVS|nr:unnamed protein product [Eruca vesicaria subsp. sativa]
MPEPNTNQMMYVSSDVLELILLRLPPKSLGRFKTVSKQWRSLLESNWFLEMHLSFQKSGKTRRKILAADHCNCGNPPTLRPRVSFKGGEAFVYLHCDATLPSMSCDGLICIPEPGWINVLNPVTGKRLRFASGPGHVFTLLKRRNSYPFTNDGVFTVYFPGYWAMGFGKDKVNGRYKVVRMLFDSNRYEVLDVNIGEWRKLSPPPYEVEAGRRSAYVNGSIYWSDILRGCRLLSLDLHTEEFHPVPLPTDIRFTVDTQIVNLEDHLALATTLRNGDVELELEIWIMDDDDDSAWSKTYSISLACLDTMQFRQSAFKPVMVSKQGGDVLFRDNRQSVFRYRQLTDTVTQICSCTDIISPYLENMVRFENEQVEPRTRVRCTFNIWADFPQGVPSSQPRVDMFHCKEIFRCLAGEDKTEKVCFVCSFAV